MRKITIIFLTSFLFLQFFLIFSPFETCSASGITIYVDDDGGADYTSIQDAINAANASGGDTIYVYSGIYNENIVINKPLILTGQNKDTTIIDGGKSGHTIYAFSGTEYIYIEISISEFTVRNAGGTGNDCIALRYVNNGQIYGNKIKNSDQSDGIQLYRCSGITISSNTVQNNEENGINLVLSTDNTIGADNIIQNNQKGIRLYFNSNNNNIYSNTITGNTNYGIHILSSTNNQIYLNDFTGNGQHAQDASSNTYYYNSQGNYWEDYNNYETDPLVPYDIPGGSNQDLYPLGYYINEEPQAYIDSITPSPATQGQTVTFQGHSTDDGNILEWEWTSSINGKFGTSEDVTYSSLSTGTHTIKFRVKDDDDQWSDYSTQTLAVNTEDNGGGDQKPTATIVKPSTSATVTANQGESVEFQGYGTPSEGMILEYSWRSNKDGTIGTTSYFTKSSLSVGIHTIYFKVKDINGWSDEVSSNLVILEGSGTEPTNNAPTADAGGPYTGYEGFTIVFDGSGSTDDTTITTYGWDFGDGETGSGYKLSHTYTTSGNYTITLTVTDDSGLSNTDTTTATITSGDNTNNNDDTTNNNDTPGFEIITILLAITILLFSKKKK